MKIIITESQFHLLRRRGMIEDLFKKYVDDDEFIYRVLGTTRVNFDEFIPIISYTIAQIIAKDEIKPTEDGDNDGFVMFRNQLQRYIQNNYYDYLKKRYQETIG